MAAVLSQHSTTGFYKAPVSKTLLGSLFLTCTAINVPLFVNLRQFLICKIPDVLFSRQVFRIITARLAFIETKDFICGALLLYYFRIFERRYGSQKFSSFLLSTSFIAMVLETVAVVALGHFKSEWYSSGIIPPGPYALIFPLFVLYFYDIPRVTQSHFLGLPVTGKTITYLIGIQMLASSRATAVSVVCGIIAGLIYRRNPLNLFNRLKIPEFICRLAEMTLGKLVASAPPPDAPMGATLEIQRQEEIERLEQQMLLQRARDVRRVTGRLPGRNGGDAADALRQRNNHVTEPSETDIRTLMDLGFSREQTVEALRLTGNNVLDAANFLLMRNI